jgi:Uma2 family endonuclease
VATASPSLIPRLTEEEYLFADRENAYRSEFIDGGMIPMPGGTLRHSALAARCVTTLHQKLAGADSTVFNSDARVRTPSSSSYVYPDVSIVKGSVIARENTTDILLNPFLVVEVLSTATKKFDRGGKFDLYREIESLHEYLILHTDSERVEHYSRQADNSWLYRETKGTEATLFISALELTLPMAQLYGSTMSLPG